MWWWPQCCWDCIHSLLFEMGERRRKKDTKRKDIRAAICKLARWQRLGLRKALRETAVGGGGGEPVWDQPQAKHQIQELGDEGVWGLSLYPGLSGKRASFPFLYSLFFPVLFTSLLAMNPWYEKSILQKWRNRRILCTLNIQYLLACGWEFLKGHA